MPPIAPCAALQDGAETGIAVVMTKILPNTVLIIV
jgi:hypothetical protein